MKNKVIIGSWPLSGDLGFTDLKTVSETLSACISNGFYSFDTAPNYGNGFAENCLGKLKNNSSELAFFTKFGSLQNGDKDYSNDSLSMSLKGSLDRLNTSHVDTVFLHNPRGNEFDYKRHKEFFDYLKDIQLIRHSGLSLAKGENYDSDEISWFDNIMDDFNLLYLSDLSKYDTVNQNFIARSPLATGILSGKINNSSKFNTDDYRHSWLKEKRLDSIMKRVRSIEALSDISIKSLAIRYILSNPNVHKMIIGVRSTKHVEDLAKDIEKPPLSSELIKAIEDLENNNFGLSEEEGIGF